MSARCRTCGAEIIWAITINKRAMPLDATPSPKGNLRFAPEHALPEDRAPVVVHSLDAPERYTSHFATCAQAAQHRRAR